MNENRLITRLLPAVALALVSVAVYANTIDGEFVSDDIWQVLQNPWITGIGYVPEVFTSAVWDFKPEMRPGSGQYYRPVMFLLYMACYAVAGLEPWGYHIVNIAFHAANSVFLFFLALRLLRGWPGGKPGEGNGGLLLTGGAFFTALLFATHPVNTESVAWVATQTELLFTLLFMVGLYLYISRRYTVSALVFLVSLFTKETAIVLPIMLLAWDLAAGPENDKEGRPSFIRRYAPYGVAVAVYAAARTYALGAFASETEAAARLLSRYEATVNVVRSLAEYLKTLVLPVDLTYYHHFRFEPLRSITEPTALVLWTAALASLYAMYRFRKSAQPLFLAVCWVVIPLLPVLGLNWLKGNLYFSERYLYLPSAGFALFVSVLFLRGVSLASSRVSLKAAGAVAAAVLVAVSGVYAWASVERNEEWNTGYALWKDTAEKVPDNKVARFNLGNQLAKQGKLDEAEREYLAVIELDPEYAKVYNNLGIVYAKQGRIGDAAEEFAKTLRLDPDNTEARDNLQRAIRMLNERRGR